jgi:hypothetical protein
MSDFLPVTKEVSNRSMTVSDELIIMLREVVVTYLRYHHSICMEGLKNIMNICISVATCRPSMKQECQIFRYFILLCVQDGSCMAISDLSNYFMGLGLVSDQRGGGGGGSSGSGSGNDSCNSQQQTQPQTAGVMMPAPPPLHQSHHPHNYQSQPPAPAVASAAPYWQPQQQSSPIQVTGSNIKINCSKYITQNCSCLLTLHNHCYISKQHCT